MSTSDQPSTNVPNNNTATTPQSTQAPQSASQNLAYAGAYGGAYPSTYASGYGGLGGGVGYSGYGGYGGYGAYSGYGSSLGLRSPYMGSSMYSGYGNGMMGMGVGMGMNALGNQVQQFMSPGQNMLQGVQTVMHTFARASGLFEEVIRSFHMIFESLFGLAFSLSSIKTELGAVWNGVGKNEGNGVVSGVGGGRGGLKEGWKGVIKEWLKKVLKSWWWKVLVVMVMSPLAGRFSPVAVILKLFGLVPQHAELSKGSVEEVVGDEAQNGEVVESVRTRNKTDVNDKEGSVVGSLSDSSSHDDASNL